MLGRERALGRAAISGVSSASGHSSGHGATVARGTSRPQPRTRATRAAVLARRGACGVAVVRGWTGDTRGETERPARVRRGARSADRARGGRRDRAFMRILLTKLALIEFIMDLLTKRQRKIHDGRRNLHTMSRAGQEPGSAVAESL